MSTLNKVYDIAIIGSGSLSQVCAVLSQHYELDTVLIKANENESKNYDSLMLDDETMRLMNSIGVLENIIEDIFSPYFTDLILPIKTTLNLSSNKLIYSDDSISF